MDAFARPDWVAAAIREDGRLANFVKERYSGLTVSLGQDRSRYLQL